ncbi:PPR domain-containing protein/PPR_2 domain-containing protein/PPR_3 domain-containing protein [Cephalotus follicularis]|uniref:PPR domain-containing protein/PPR_2 domain-containing protein/PPR_3 domain-containing protein n=1 Tax=Cephalotus follicularis TaxID=3775 RepID=A0A1Q3D150_CEPFO|nr:PPR domain-containing protein/PPR_2 domain-containing protein/PPR_3 domain-containing protein [Cephalotus follicularis]
MLGIRITRSYLSRISILIHTHFNSSYNKPNPYPNSIPQDSLKISLNRSSTIYFSSSTPNLETPDTHITSKSLQVTRQNHDNGNKIDDDSDEVSEDSEVTNVKISSLSNEGLAKDVNAIIDILREFRSNGAEKKSKLDNSGIKVYSELVVEVLSRVRNDWEVAFTFFLWAGKQPGYAHSLREYHSMISILGKMRKFDTAWVLIDEMRGAKIGPSLVTPQTLLIMIRRYCAVHNVGRAINTFYAYKKFKFDVGIDEFQSLLSALCRYKNVQDAEQMMFCNKDRFPFDTKSFNIILNGWCNVIVSQRQAERVWREMSRRGVHYDAVSFGCIMSCYSKAHNLHKVLRLFDQMKKLGIEPDRKVYNAVIHALAKGGMVTEAVNLMNTMAEKGIAPNIVTYNSLIKPLCKARKIDEAGGVFHEMLQRGLSPTIRTYHAFLRILRTGQEVFELLEKMRKFGCQPTIDTYIMLIRKFCRWRQFDDVFKLWNEMSRNGKSPDRSSYIVLIHGLFLNGKLEEAYKYNVEMKEKQFLPEPKIDEMLQAWLSDKQLANRQMAELNNKQSGTCQSVKRTRVMSRKIGHEKDFLREPETRRVVRERGFSFWEQ